MNFDAFSGNRRSRRQSSLIQAPAVVESLETRALLAIDPLMVTSPQGTIANSQPLVNWKEYAGAVSYDIWISDVEARQRIVFKEGVVGDLNPNNNTFRQTRLSGAERLNLGANRIWVRATLGDGTKTDWGSPGSVLLRTTPVITGPTSINTPGEIIDSNWSVNWNSPVGATSFDVFVSDQTSQTSTIYNVLNMTPALDAFGNAILDGEGNAVLEENRSLFLDGAVPIIGATPQAVTNAVSRSFVDITSSNHGLATGDQVRISGVLGTPGANGNFTVTVISANVFRLNNATSAGTYTSGGRWIRLVNSAPATGATSRSITGVTISKAIDVTVPNHGLRTGDQVRITGVEGNTAANGTFFVTVLTRNVIQLKGVSGTDFFTNGGQLTRLTEFRSTLLLGSYKIFVRSTDDGGRVSPWSAPLEFEIAPPVRVRRPMGSTFDFQPLLTWDAVPGATHYEVEVFKAGEATPLFSAPYLTTTSFRIPEALPDDPTQVYEFHVRARRLHQVSYVTLSGTPTSGGFQISLTTTGDTPTTSQTGLLSYLATAADVEAAVTALNGFENVQVSSLGVAPNVTFLLQIPLTGNAGNPGVIGGNPVKVSVVGTVSPGAVSSRSKVSPTVDGVWSPLVTFSTLSKPVITGPLGIDTNDPNQPRTVTDLRPTVEWTPIDGAARYEIWVERSASSATYLQTSSSTNSYKFESDLIEGNYTVRVRAISTKGVFTDWSELYAFTATGGRTVISAVTVAPGRRATIQWVGVAEAASYEIQIAWIGVNFDYLHPTGITTTSFTTTNALSPGNYRVWVRAVLADGTALGWSKFVNFSVVKTDAPNSELIDPSTLVALTSLLPVTEGEVSADTVESTPDSTASDVMIADQSQDDNVNNIHDIDSAVMTNEVPNSDMENAELIQQLAEACVRQEWWGEVNPSST